MIVVVLSGGPPMAFAVVMNVDGCSPVTDLLLPIFAPIVFACMCFFSEILFSRVIK